jgi:hypothetical protein
MQAVLGDLAAAHSSHFSVDSSERLVSSFYEALSISTAINGY